MNPQFYVEIESVLGNDDSTSYSPARKRFCEPLDLSYRRDSVDTVHTTSSLYSNRTVSPSEHFPHNGGWSGSYFHHSTPHNSLYSYEIREAPSPDFPYFGREECSPYMIEATALQRRLLAASDVGQSDTRLCRPFRAYPEYPHNTSLSTGDTENVENFQLYRQEMLNETMDSRGGLPTKSNPNMRRVGHSQSADMEATSSASKSDSSCTKDIAYLQRREKNNAAVRKSRDLRRIKENEIAKMAAFLEQENLECQDELASANKEVAALSLELALVRSQLALSCPPDCDIE